MAGNKPASLAAVELKRAGPSPWANQRARRAKTPCNLLGLHPPPALVSLLKAPSEDGWSVQQSVQSPEQAEIMKFRDMRPVSLVGRVLSYFPDTRLSSNCTETTRSHTSATGMHGKAAKLG